jgi:phosphatidate cytidylyltransferase
MEGSRSRQRPRRRQRSDVSARVLTAIPAIAFAIFIVSQGGLVFALGVIALGILAQTELYTMMARVRPVNLAGFLTLIALVLAALYGNQDDKSDVLLVLVLSVPLTFFLGLLRPRRENVSWAMAVTFLGIMWIGLAVAHAVFLRELDHGGGLVLDVLIGTFIGDTCAYFGGRAWGHRRLAPRISPNKTLEGLLTGIVGGTLAFWLFAVAYQHEWFKGPDALLIGFCVSLAGPVGDLFESLIKRDLEVKDTGRFFGAHGGVLDRLDAVLFTLVTAYYVSRAVLG